MAYKVYGNYHVKTHDKLHKFILQKEQGFVEQTELDDDFYFLKSHIKVHEDETFYIQGNSSYLIMTFLLDGMANYQQKTNQFSINTKQGYFTMTLNKSIEGLKSFYKNQDTKSIQFIIGKQNLHKMLPDGFLEYFYNKNLPLIHIKTAPISPQANFILLQLFKLKIDQNLNKLLIQSKIYELLHKELSNLHNEKRQSKKVKFDSYDKESLQEAKIILEQNFQNTPSIRELSKKVCLNEFKLKYGFRKFFDTSIYAYALSCKMNKAKFLLKENELNINQIAKELGYKYTCNFSNTFKKHFGFSPKKFI